MDQRTADIAAAIKARAAARADADLGRQRPGRRSTARPRAVGSPDRVEHAARLLRSLAPVDERRAVRLVSDYQRTGRGKAIRAAAGDAAVLAVHARLTH